MKTNVSTIFLHGSPEDFAASIKRGYAILHPVSVSTGTFHTTEQMAQHLPAFEHCSQDTFGSQIFLCETVFVLPRVLIFLPFPAKSIFMAIPLWFIGTHLTKEARAPAEFPINQTKMFKSFISGVFSSLLKAD